MTYNIDFLIAAMVIYCCWFYGIFWDRKEQRI